MAPFQPSILDAAALAGVCVVAKQEQPSASCTKKSTKSYQLVCIKEGCTTTLTSAHPDTKRCHEHANQCIKINCSKQKRGKDVYCASHRRMETMKHSSGKHLCLKEGCQNPLAANQTKRCVEHKNQCKKKGCSKWSRSCDEYCYKHGRQVKSQATLSSSSKSSLSKSSSSGSSATAHALTTKFDINVNRICVKEGCNNVLKPHQPSRCRDHIMKCIEKGCTEYFEEGQRGYCYKHGPREN